MCILLLTIAKEATALSVTNSHVFTMLDQLPLSQQFLKDTTNALKEAFAKNIK